MQKTCISAFFLVIGCGGAGADSPVSPDGAPDEGVEDAVPVDASPAETTTDAPADALDASDAVDASDVSDAPPPAPATVLSLNLHCLKTSGTAFSTNKARFAAIADVVAAEGVTAVAVQEACKNASESAMDLLDAELKRATGVTWSKTWAFAHTAWEGTPDEAEEGLGLFVRGPLSGDDVVIHRVQSALVRVAIGAKLPSGERLWSVHFDHANAAARSAQAREMAVRALVDTDPGFAAIVAGDYNARAGEDAHRALTSFGFRDLSSGLDANRIDHVLAHRASGLTAAAAKMLFDGKGTPRVSDHPGVLVRLSSGTKEPVTVTRILGKATLATGQWLALRGGTAPLTWDAGWAARPTDAGWKVVLTELTGPKVEIKLLRDDVTWMTGANATVTPGTDVTIEPKF